MNPAVAAAWHLDGLTVGGEAGVNGFTGHYASYIVVDHIPSAAGQAEIETALKDRYDIQEAA